MFRLVFVSVVFACEKSSLGVSGISCKGHSDDKFEFHYGVDASSKDMTLCGVNKKSEGWVSIGIASGMKPGTISVIGTGDGMIMVHDLTSSDLGAKADIGHTAATNTVVDGGRRLCFTIPSSKKPSDGGYSWAFGSASAAKARHDSAGRAKAEESGSGSGSDDEESSFPLIPVVVAVIVAIIIIGLVVFMQSNKKKPVAPPKRSKKQTGRQ